MYEHYLILVSSLHAYGRGYVTKTSINALSLSVMNQGVFGSHVHTDMQTYIHTYIGIVIVTTTYHAVYRSYRASHTERWFMPCSMPWVPGPPQVAHSLTEDPEDRLTEDPEYQGHRPTRIWGQWQL